MNRAYWAALGLLLSAGLQAGAGEPGTSPPGPCEPGYRWVQEDSFQEVERCVCKAVPSVKKVRKVVYETKPDPFCVRLASFRDLFAGKGKGGEADCGEGCLKCKGPHHRAILVKTEITCEVPSTRCVVEKVVEKVPCKVWRKVPCAPGAPPADPTKR